METGPDLGAQVHELAARRREMELEFDAKMRDLKAQHQRRADHLKREQEDWEGHRRAQAKEIADRAERLRRQEANRERRTETGHALEGEVARLREEVAAAREAKVEAVRARNRAVESSIAAQAGLRRAIVRGRLAVASLAAGVLGWWAMGGRAGAVALGVAVVAAAGLSLFGRLGESSRSGN